ncbi:MBL fold metallo-hydrolase [Flammeovirgaceae bacterium SG7u.111]|nr:MBL fold metallo-hydrolase [Flammeovirgaceae bacterium SG7u.132]WPO35044.1 MBL fold metallo-hydrolase [Flammeovirgaceae bacterium SG7u.111]
MITIQEFTFNAFGENTYLLFDDSRECIIIDPGCYDKVEREELVEFIEEKKLKVSKVVNTHCHVDHVLGNEFAKTKFGVNLYIPEKEQEVLGSVPSYAPVYGFPAYSHAEPDGFLTPDQKLTFGNSSLDILFVPGHSPGHLAFYCKEQKFCINGDVLFHGSIGRTDLPGGNHQQLLNSIKNVMFKLPDDTRIFCGHGPSTNIAYEKKHNPFCGGM